MQGGCRCAAHQWVATMRSCAQVSSKVHATRLAQCREVELQLVAHGRVSWLCKGCSVGLERIGA